MFQVLCQVLLATAAAKSLQSCPALCDPIDGSPPGSAVTGTLQARTLGWVAISFSKAWKRKVKVKLLSCFWLLATPWTAAHQAPPPTGFARQEYRSGVPLPSPSFMQNLPHYQPPSPGCTVISVDKPAYHFMANRWGNNGNWETLFSWAPKSLQMVTVATKLKDTFS